MDHHSQQPGQPEDPEADDPGMAPESGEHGDAEGAGPGASGGATPGAQPSGDDVGTAPESGDR